MMMKRINLIPQENRIDSSWRSSMNVLLFKDFSRSAVTILLILVGIGAFQLVDTVRLKILISSRKGRIAKMEAQSSQHGNLYMQLQMQKEAVARQRKRIEDKIVSINRIKKNMARWSNILEDVSKITPPGISLHTVSLKKDLISIAGTTLDNISVSKFMQLLDDSGNFRDTSFAYTRKEQAVDEEGETYDIINFELTTHLNG